MDYYDMNLECLKTNKHNLYQALCAVDEHKLSNRLEEITSVNTKTDAQALMIKYRSTEFRLNSVYHPVDEAKKWVSQYTFHNLNNVISMFGLGNGIFVREIKNLMRKQDNLIIYEPCADIFFYILHQYDITDILSDDRIHIAVEKMNELEFHRRLLGNTNITNLNSQIICIHPKYDTIFPESCILFWKEIKDTYSNALVHINTTIVFGIKYIENTLNNLKFLNGCSTFIELKDTIPKDIPAIVVAAGPSVEKQIEDLKRVKGKAVIFAVDRILDYLLDMGIEPDFVVTLDPIKPVEFFSKRLDVTTPLLYFMEANSQILEIHKGKKILCNSGDFLYKTFLDLGKIPPRVGQSASVATVAFTACVELGFTNIILVGQDLAYSGEHTHAGGNDEKEAANEIAMVEGIDGTIIKSRYDWKMFITWYQDVLRHIPHITVIDAKEQGAKIKGTTNMSLKKAIDTYCIGEFEYVNQTSSMKPTFSEDDLVKLDGLLHKKVDTLQEIYRKSKEAVSLCETLISETKKNISSPKIDSLLKRLEKINGYIYEQPIYCLMNLYVSAAAAQYISKMYQFTDNIETNSIQTFQRTKCIFEAIIEASEYIEPLLLRTLEG